MEREQEKGKKKKRVKLCKVSHVIKLINEIKISASFTSLVWLNYTFSFKYLSDSGAIFIFCRSLCCFCQLFLDQFEIKRFSWKKVHFLFIGMFLHCPFMLKPCAQCEVSYTVYYFCFNLRIYIIVSTFFILLSLSNSTGSN